MFKIDPDACLLCNEPLQSELRVMTAKQRQMNVLMRLSLERSDGLSEYLTKRSEIELHYNCYQNYKQILEKQHTNPHIFPYEELCFICEKPAGKDFVKKDLKHQKDRRNVVSIVEKESTQRTLIRYAENMQPPNTQLLDRIKNLEQKKARYHKKCFIYLMHFRRLAAVNPISNKVVAAMVHVYDYIESTEDKHYFLRELVTVIEGKSDYVPDRRTIKIKLMEKYKNAVSFYITPSNNTLIYIKDPNDESEEIVQYWKSEEERLKIVKKAAKILRNDVFREEPKLPGSLRAFIEIIATQDADEGEKNAVSEAIAAHIKLS